jgi:transcription initiation factor TFIID TATA-box-binding protein
VPFLPCRIFKIRFHACYEPKVVILVFASGNLVCTGARREQEFYGAVHKLHERLEEQNLIFYE